MFITADGLADAYRQRIGKEKKELAEYRLRPDGDWFREQCRWAGSVELVIQTEWVRYVRVGRFAITDTGVVFTDITSKTRLTVKAGEIPRSAEFYTTEGEGPLFRLCALHGLIEGTKRNAYNGHWFFPTDDVESTCYFSGDGLVVGEVVVATSDELIAEEHNPNEMLNGCKFDACRIGVDIYRAKGGLMMFDE